MLLEDVANRLNQVLVHESFFRAVFERLARKRDEAAQRKETSYADASLSQRLLWDRQIILCDNKLADLLEKHVFLQLPRPHPITPTDLEEVAFAQLGGVAGETFTDAWERGDAFSAAYLRFVEYVLLRLPPEEGHMEANDKFDLGDWPILSKGQESLEAEVCAVLAGELCEKEDADPPDQLWGPPDSPFWFMVEFVEAKGMEAATGLRGMAAVAHPHFFRKGCGTLCGYASRAAMEQAEREFRRLLPSVLQSMGFLPGCSRLTEGLCRMFFRDCVSSYFAEPAKKTDNMTQRMRNAVHLLVEADAQQNDVIALSLCFSAIEALVCTKKTDITEQLSRNVAALLQPDPHERKAAMEHVRELYRIRCKTLHGEAAVDDAARNRARPLAAVVLGAVVDWIKYQRRMEDTSERKEFLEQLDDAERNARRMPGVREEFSRCLPGLHA